MSAPKDSIPKDSTAKLKKIAKVVFMTISITLTLAIATNLIFQSPLIGPRKKGTVISRDLRINCGTSDVLVEANIGRSFGREYKSSTLHNSICVGETVCFEIEEVKGIKYAICIEKYKERCNKKEPCDKE